jgi:uncharacterized 2Fe-2S/4Fe-4S cluster protein (DUF4445 family)
LPQSVDAGSPAAGDQNKPSDEARLVFQPSGRRGHVAKGTTLLDGANQLGVGIESLCRGVQTCGKCRVRIEDGTFEKEAIVSSMGHTSPVTGTEQAQLSSHKALPNERLACATAVLDDLVVYVPEQSRTSKQIVRKAAGERAIELDPAIRLVCLDVPAATLADEGRGDLERLKEALLRQFDLENLTVDYAVLPYLQRALRQEDWRITVTLWQDREIVRVQPGIHDVALGLAVDIGSTTVAAYLCNLRTGELLATESTMNPQVAYGEDIMSRISYVQEHENGLATLHQAIVATINQLAETAVSQANLDLTDIVEVTLVGNTVMHHLVLNLDPSYLGGLPFPTCLCSSIDVKARQLGFDFNPGCYVHVLPIKASYVGADNMAVVLAEAPHEQDEIMLVIDVGTNGEILLGSRPRLLSASSPTGPAFEGAQITHGMRAAEGAIEGVQILPQTLDTRFKVIGREGWSDTWVDPDAELPAPVDGNKKRRRRKIKQVLAQGICGSGIIDAVAEMFKAGVLLPSGAFNPDLRSDRIVTHEGLPAFIIAPADKTAFGHDIVVTIADVRAVQLAKAALYAGTRILMERLGVNKIDKVALAGAFGSYINKESALILGLFPDCDLDRVSAVGNAAGDGARIALLSHTKRVEIEKIARWIEHVQIPMEGKFQEIFINSLSFPHATDAFPHAEALLTSE